MPWPIRSESVNSHALMARGRGGGSKWPCPGLVMGSWRCSRAAYFSIFSWAGAAHTKRRQVKVAVRLPPTLDFSVPDSAPAAAACAQGVRAGGEGVNGDRAAAETEAGRGHGPGEGGAAMRGAAETTGPLEGGGGIFLDDGELDGARRQTRRAAACVWGGGCAWWKEGKARGQDGKGRRERRRSGGRERRRSGGRERRRSGGRQRRRSGGRQRRRSRRGRVVVL